MSQHEQKCAQQRLPTDASTYASVGTVGDVCRRTPQNQCLQQDQPGTYVWKSRGDPGTTDCKWKKPVNCEWDMIVAEQKKKLDTVINWAIKEKICNDFNAVHNLPGADYVIYTSSRGEAIMYTCGNRWSNLYDAVATMLKDRECDDLDIVGFYPISASDNRFIVVRMG
jgi:hypothetical protein